MAEVMFAKQFLLTLDGRTVKLPSDHAADPRQLPAQSPFVLPRIQNPLPKPTRDLNDPATFSEVANATAQNATHSETLIDVVLKPLRATPSGPSTVTLRSQSRLTSIYELKAQVAAQTGYIPDKLKILWEKKPVLDSKTVGEFASTGDKAGQLVELGVMFIGAPTNPKNMTRAANEHIESTVISPEAPMDDKPVAQGISGVAVLGTEAFWNDLHGFIVQRTKDEELGNTIVQQFRESWNAKSG